MKRSVLGFLVLGLALSACTPQPSPSAADTTHAAAPAGYALGSPSNTTTGFDGSYMGVAVQNNSRGNSLAVAGGNAPIFCQNYGPPPPIKIANGLAQFELLNYTFRGYVTPQGHLKMGTGYGHTIEGQIDAQGMFRAQGLGACAYNATWRKSS